MDVQTYICNSLVSISKQGVIAQDDASPRFGTTVYKIGFHISILLETFQLISYDFKLLHVVKHVVKICNLILSKCMCS